MGAHGRKRATMTRKRGRKQAAGAAAYEGCQSAGLDEILRESDEGDAKRTRAAVDAALDDVKAGKYLDPRIIQLFRDFKLYRVLVVVIVVIGFALMLASMYLYSTGAIDGQMQTNLLILANVVVVAGMAIGFGRARPIREDINAWYKVNAMALKDSKGAHGATRADIDKIFLSRARNRHVPPTPEFKAIRRAWLALIVAAVALMAVAVLLAQRDMSDVTVPVVLIIVAFVILLGALIVDRVKMKPLREQWDRELKEKVKQAGKASKRAKPRR